MQHKHKFILSIFLISGILLLSMLPVKQGVKASFSIEDLRSLHAPIFANVDPSQYFPTQQDCSGCHG